MNLGHKTTMRGMKKTAKKKNMKKPMKKKNNKKKVIKL